MKSIRFTKKKTFISLAVILLLVIGISWCAYQHFSNTNTQKITTSSNGQATVNLDPPTKEEKADAENNKDNVINRQNQDAQTTPPSGITTVTPVISSWGQDAYTKSLSVAAYVPGVFEDGGTCTLVVSYNGSQQTNTRTGAKNVSNVSCGYIEIPRSSLTAGEWTATISYSSATSQGTSAPQKIKVE